MGYEVKRVIRLEFGEPVEGEESPFVRLNSISFGQFMAVEKDIEAGSAELAASTLAESLVEWNFTDGGEPIPCTREGLDSLDPALRALVLGEWLTVLRSGGKHHPLARRSSDGVKAPSMSMEDL